MKLEDYFDFQAPNDIRLKGHRIGIETILFDYLDLGLIPEEIVLRYPTLNLEKVYATITYYWRNQEEVDRYMQEWKDYGDRMREEQARNPSPAIKRLRKLIQQRQSETYTEVMQEV